MIEPVQYLLDYAASKNAALVFEPGAGIDRFLSGTCKNDIPAGYFDHERASGGNRSIEIKLTPVSPNCVSPEDQDSAPDFPQSINYMHDWGTFHVSIAASYLYHFWEIKNQEPCGKINLHTFEAGYAFVTYPSLLSKMVKFPRGLDYHEVIERLVNWYLLEKPQAARQNPRLSAGITAMNKAGGYMPACQADLVVDNLSFLNAALAQAQISPQHALDLMDLLRAK